MKKMFKMIKINNFYNNQITERDFIENLIYNNIQDLDPGHPYPSLSHAQIVYTYVKSQNRDVNMFLLETDCAEENENYQIPRNLYFICAADKLNSFPFTKESEFKVYTQGNSIQALDPHKLAQSILFPKIHLSRLGDRSALKSLSVPPESIKNILFHNDIITDENRLVIKLDYKKSSNDVLNMANTFESYIKKHCHDYEISTTLQGLELKVSYEMVNHFISYCKNNKHSPTFFNNNKNSDDVGTFSQRLECN